MERFITILRRVPLPYQEKSPPKKITIKGVKLVPQKETIRQIRAYLIMRVKKKRASENMIVKYMFRSDRTLPKKSYKRQ